MISMIFDLSEIKNMSIKVKKLDPLNCPHCWDDRTSTTVAGESNGLVDVCCLCDDTIEHTQNKSRGEHMSKSKCPHVWDDGSEAVRSCGAVEICNRCSEMFRSSFVSAWAK